LPRGFYLASSLDKPVADLFAWHLKKRDPLLQILREVQVVASFCRRDYARPSGTAK